MFNFFFFCSQGDDKKKREKRLETYLTGHSLLLHPVLLRNNQGNLRFMQAFNTNITAVSVCRAGFILLIEHLTNLITFNRELLGRLIIFMKQGDFFFISTRHKNIFTMGIRILQHLLLCVVFPLPPSSILQCFFVASIHTQTHSLTMN